MTAYTVGTAPFAADCRVFHSGKMRRPHFGGPTPDIFLFNEELSWLSVKYPSTALGSLTSSACPVVPKLELALHEGFSHFVEHANQS